MNRRPLSMRERVLILLSNYEGEDCDTLQGTAIAEPESIYDLS